MHRAGAWLQTQGRLPGNCRPLVVAPGRAAPTGAWPAGRRGGGPGSRDLCRRSSDRVLWAWNPVGVGAQGTRRDGLERRGRRHETSQKRNEREEREGGEGEGRDSTLDRTWGHLQSSREPLARRMLVCCGKWVPFPFPATRGPSPRAGSTQPSELPSRLSFLARFLGGLFPL